MKVWLYWAEFTLLVDSTAEAIIWLIQQVDEPVKIVTYDVKEPET